MLKDMKRLSLWQYTKQFINDAEIQLVQEFINSSCDDFIENNQILWNEVASLTQILEELSPQDDNPTCCHKSMTMVENGSSNDYLHTDKKLDFISWQCIETLTLIEKLLVSKDCDEEMKDSLFESYPNIHELLLLYNHSNGINENEKVEQYNHFNSKSDGNNNYFQMIDGIKSQLNILEILLVVDSIHEAFRLEASALMTEANTIRIKIDAKYESTSNGSVQFDKKVFAEINSFKKKLETKILATKQSLKLGEDGRVNYLTLPPLREMASQSQLQLQGNHDYIVRDNQKENDDPRTELKATSSVLRPSKSKKKINIENALVLANKMKLNHQYSSSI